MAQPIPPVYPTDYGGDQTSDGQRTVQATVEATKDQAGQVSQSAAGAGQHVAQVAKEQLGTVAGEAGRQTRDLLNHGRSELTAQAGQQKQRVTAGLQTLSSELHSMAQHDGSEGLATDLARQGARQIGELASWLDSREPGQLVNELKSFARRRPGTFLLLAAGLGLAAGRVTRGVADSGDQSAADSQPATIPSETAVPPATTGPPAPTAPLAPMASAPTEVLPGPTLPAATIEYGETRYGAGRPAGLAADEPPDQPPELFDDLPGRMP
jgi:hypothetical protein